MPTPMAPKPDVRARRRAGIAMVILALAPHGALAVTIDDVLPLYFDAVSGQGFDPVAIASLGLVSSFDAGPDDDWINAGEGAFPIQITRSFGPVHANPDAPTFGDPVIADSLWQIENVSAGDLIAPLLVFTNVDPAGTYPIAPPPLALDGHLVDLLTYRSDDPGQSFELVYGVVQLPDLPQGATTDVLVRYIAAGELADGSPQPLPPLGVLVLGSYVVPEPATAALLIGGLVGLAGARRGRVRG